MDTLLLDRDNWDVTVDATGNIALASAPYAILQDVASACRLFLGEAYYDTTKGVPYFSEALGRSVPTPLLKARMEEAARAVPGVTSARCVLTLQPDRVMTGQIQVTTDGGSFTLTV